MTIKTDTRAKTRRPLRAIRLTEIDCHTRLKAAREAARWTPDPGEKSELLAAALFPSDRIYWVVDTDGVAA